jgi:hypothetical protein
MSVLKNGGDESSMFKLLQKKKGMFKETKKPEVGSHQAESWELFENYRFFCLVHDSG